MARLPKLNFILMIVTRVVACLLLLIIGGSLMRYLITSKPEPAKTEGTRAGRNILVLPLEPLEIGRVWDGYGTVRVMDSADVPARVTATVSEMPAGTEIGDRVARGALLAELDRSDFLREVEMSTQRIAEFDAQFDQLGIEDKSAQQRLGLAGESVQLARDDYERMVEIIRDEAGGPVELDASRRALIQSIQEEVDAREVVDAIPLRRMSLESRREAEQTALRQAQENLARCRIVSPIDGILEEVDVEVGENLSSGQRVARVVGLDRVEVRLRLPAGARADLRTGDAVVLWSTGGSVKRWDATVARIAPVDDPATRTMSVFVEHHQSGTESNLLAPGRFVGGSVRSADRRMRWVIPRRSVQSGRIWVIEDGTLRSRPVAVDFHIERESDTFGLPDRAWVVVEGDLEVGDQLVVTAATSLVEGMPATPVLAGAAASVSRDGVGSGADLGGAPPVSLPRFGVLRPVPVNLLMSAFIIVGVFSAVNLTREFFPETQPESASVTLIYPGATPQEVEEGLARKVEDVIADLDEVDQITTSLSEGGGGIVVEFEDGVEIREAVDEVERAIDSLRDLPAEAEEIETVEIEPRLPVIMVTLFGEAEEEVRKREIHRVRDDLLTLPGMGEVSLTGVRDYEVRVEVSAEALLAQELSLPQVSDAVRGWMSDVPAGAIRTNVGTFSVRTLGVDERADAIREIVVKATADGGVIRIGDIATVEETYVDERLVTRFATRDGGGPALSLTIYKVGDQDAVKIAEMVRSYVAGRRGDAFEARVSDRLLSLLAPPSTGKRAGPDMRTNRRRAYDLGVATVQPIPEGCDLETHSDLAVFIEGRLSLLVRNAKWGALLVFGTLLLFLNWRVATWVGIGLATALCGTLAVMYVVGITLNLLTMFGLIVVLGLLVDDAIVVAENMQARHDRGEPALVSAIRGTEQVFWPVVATVMTSIVAFMPLTFVKGTIGDLLGALPYVVVCALLMSLVESVLILPSHMGHSLAARDRARPGRITNALRKFETWRDHMILDVVVPAYARLLGLSLRWRYVSVCFAIATLLFSVGMVLGGRVAFTFLPTSDSETLIVDVRMPIGTSIDETERIVRLVEASAQDQPETRSISTYVGIKTSVDDTGGVAAAGRGDHLAQLFVELFPVEQRDRESSSVIASIREQIGTPVGVDEITFSEIQGGPGGADITLQVIGEDEASVNAVAMGAQALLATRAGVVDITDDNYAGQRELQVQLKPGAAALGFTVAAVAQQVRGAVFGLEPHVFSQRREDIDVRVLLAEEDRARLSSIESLWLRSPSGALVPLSEIAEIIEGTSYASIRRVDRRRTITVSADTTPEANPEEIMPSLRAEFDELLLQHPGVVIDEGGRQRQMAKAFSSLPIGFGAAIVLIYVILAWLFESYLQPIAVMLAIPFGVIGVVWGHLVLGYDLTFLSLIGTVALSGIVVNDSLILMEFYNERRREGMPLQEALVAAGRQRLRPIFLTTITTVLGLTPLMLEQSFQAKFLIPMAISISFGLMSATVLILLVLPCIILQIEDLKNLAHLMWFGRRREPPAHPVAFDEIPGLDM